MHYNTCKLKCQHLRKSQYPYLYVILLVSMLHSLFVCYFIITACPKYCSLCYNATECYECVHGFFLNEEAECESKF